MKNLIAATTICIAISAAEAANASEQTVVANEETVKIEILGTDQQAYVCVPFRVRIAVHNISHSPVELLADESGLPRDIDFMVVEDGDRRRSTALKFRRAKRKTIAPGALIETDIFGLFVNAGETSWLIRSGSVKVNSDIRVTFVQDIEARDENALAALRRISEKAFGKRYPPKTELACVANFVVSSPLIEDIAATTYPDFDTMREHPGIDEQLLAIAESEPDAFFAPYIRRFVAFNYIGQFEHFQSRANHSQGSVSDKHLRQAATAESIFASLAGKDLLPRGTTECGLTECAILSGDLAKANQRFEAMRAIDSDYTRSKIGFVESSINRLKATGQE